jgi:hypothetical protein
VPEYAEEFLRRWFAQVNFRILRNIILRNRSVSLKDMAVKGDSKRLSSKDILKRLGERPFGKEELRVDNIDLLTNYS